MKIMFLTSEGFDTPNSINHLSMTLIDDLLSAGIQVYLVSSHKKGIYDDIPDILKNREGFSYDIIKRNVIDRTRFVKRYIDEIKYAFKAKRKWIKYKDSIDAVLLQSNPNSIYMAILLKLFLRKPIIYNLYDVFPGHAYDIGVIKNKFVYNSFKLLQKLLYKLCDKIVVISEDMKRILINEGVPENKLCIIYNWFDTKMMRFIPKEENRFIKNNNLPEDKFYVQYAGLLGYVLDYEMILNVAEILKEYEEIVFLLIGDGNVKEKILKEIKARKLTNIWYYPWQPIDLISDVYSACDIGFIPLKKGVIGNGVPSKAWQLMSCKRVVLNSVEQSNYSEIFKTYNMGVSVTNYSPQQVADAILNIYRNPQEANVMGENAYNYVKTYYTREANTKKFVELFNDIKKLREVKNV